MKLLSASTVALFLLASVSRGDEAAKELDRLQGAWAITSWQEGGKDQSDEQAKKLTLVIKDDTLTFQYEGQPKSLVMKLKLEPSARPMAVDLVSTLREGQVAKGIYERAGDELKLIWSRNNKARPAEFRTERGDDRILVRLKRVKARDEGK